MTHPPRSLPALVLLLELALGSSLAVAGAAATEPPAAVTEFVRAVPVTAAEPVATGLRGIDTPALAAHLHFLASPALAGRGLDTPSLEVAAEYLAAQLRIAGVAPFGSGSGPAAYFQELPLRRIAPPTGELTVEHAAGESGRGRSYRSGVDLLLSGAPVGALRGPVVDAGWGVREPQLGRDDWRGLDVRGRLVLVRAGAPGGPEWRTDELVGRWDATDEDDRDDAKLAIARELGAAALLVVEKDDFAARLARGELAEEESFAPFAADDEDDGPPRIRVSSAVARALLGEPSGGEAVLPRGPLPGVAVELRVEAVERTALARNVLGILPGSDPARRDEAVVLGAHYDHLGTRDGRVHPGADDNASGVAALLEIARAFAAAPRSPRRTLVFAFWTGEEEGHLGSRFYLRSPRWPLAQTAAYLNLDMIGHPWRREEIAELLADREVPDATTFLGSFEPADFVELGLPAERPELDAALRAGGAATGLTLHFDRTDGKHGGSDYRGFARRGVPFIRFFGNFFPGYHEPGDTADALAPEQVRRVARLAFATAWELADR